jgi:hypothetical protein
MNALVMLMALATPGAEPMPVMGPQPGPYSSYTVVERPGLLARFREKHPGLRARLRARFSGASVTTVAPAPSMPGNVVVPGMVQEPPLAPAPVVVPPTSSRATASYAYRP